MNTYDMIIFLYSGCKEQKWKWSYPHISILPASKEFRASFIRSRRDVDTFKESWFYKVKKNVELAKVRMLWHESIWKENLDMQNAHMNLSTVLLQDKCIVRRDLDYRLYE